MLGGDGLPQASLLAGIDGLFCEDAVMRILEWEMPGGLPVGTRREDRWRTVSSLQKAIRRGDVHAAMVAAHAAYGMDPRYLLRRLAVCAVEDVGLGNLYAVAATLALVGDKASRQLAGEQKTAIWLAAQLAGGWKDRTACNLCVCVDFDRVLHPTMHEWAHLSDADLAAKAADMDRPIEHRMMAAWMLAGTKRFWNVNVPQDNDRPRWSLMRLMAQSGMPLVLFWLADRAATRGGDCMFVSFLPLWQVLREAEDQQLELRCGALPPDPGVGPLLACAYDMHTREGKMALRRLASVPVIADLLAPITCGETRMAALYATVFTVEGGRLDLRVSLPPLDDIHFAAIRHELSYFGVDGIQAQAALMRVVRQNLGVLNSHRQRIAGERFPAMIENSSLLSGLTRQPLINLPAQPPLKLTKAPQQPQRPPVRQDHEPDTPPPGCR